MKINIKQSADNFWGWLTLITIPLMIVLMAGAVLVVGGLFLPLVILVQVVDEIAKFMKRNDIKKRGSK